MTRLEGDIVTPQGVASVHLGIAHGRIAEVSGTPIATSRADVGGSQLAADPLSHAQPPLAAESRQGHPNPLRSEA